MMRIFTSAVLLTAMAVSAPVSAHLLQKQTATMKLVDNTANFVVAVPVSAFEGVDSDGDGLLSADELARAKQTIAEQFGARFSVEDQSAGGAVPQMTWVLAPETDHSHHGHDAAGDYVIVMHRVFFDSDVTAPTVSTTLFGTGDGEDIIKLRATREAGSNRSEPLVENAALRSGDPVHTFFVPTAKENADPARAEAFSAGDDSSQMWMTGFAAMLSLAGFAGIFGARNLRFPG